MRFCNADYALINAHKPKRIWSTLIPKAFHRTIIFVNVKVMVFDVIHFPF